MSAKKFAHVINPVNVPPSSDLLVAQPITFESIRAAREWARGKIDVEIFAVNYAEDEDCVPADFRRTRPLDRSVLDFGQFGVKRKLPLISDILARLAEAAPEAEYFIYTNVDIALMPHFYASLPALLDEGYDALTITRRTISKKYTSPAELPLMYAELGTSHPGYDCFIFRREAHAQYELGHACIGAHWFGKMLELNLICQARKYAALKDLHMTFHLGDDRPWRDEPFKVYAQFNKQEIRSALLHFHAKGRLASCPEVDELISWFAPELWSSATASSARRPKRSIWQRLRFTKSRLESDPESK